MRTSNDHTHWKIKFRAFDQAHVLYMPIKYSDKDIFFRLKYITETYVFISKRRVKLISKPKTKKQL